MKVFWVENRETVKVAAGAVWNTQDLIGMDKSHVTLTNMRLGVVFRIGEGDPGIEDIIRGTLTMAGVNFTEQEYDPSKHS